MNQKRNLQLFLYLNSTKLGQGELCFRKAKGMANYVRGVVDQYWPYMSVNLTVAVNIQTICVHLRVEFGSVSAVGEMLATGIM